MFEKLKNKLLGSSKTLRGPSNPIERLREEQVYAQVLSEMEKGIRRDGIWAIALAEADFDEGKAKAIYVKRRAQAIVDEEALLKRIPLDSQSQNKFLISDLGPSRFSPDGTTWESYKCKKCGYSGRLVGIWNPGIVKGSYEGVTCPNCNDKFAVIT